MIGVIYEMYDYGQMLTLTMAVILIMNTMKTPYYEQESFSYFDSFAQFVIEESSEKG